CVVGNFSTSRARSACDSCARSRESAPSPALITPRCRSRPQTVRPLHEKKGMPDDFTWEPGIPAERGRQQPDDQPGAALPMNALRPECYASPYARAFSPSSAFVCGEIGIEPPEWVTPDDAIALAAHKLANSQSGFLPVVSEGVIVGQIDVEQILLAIARG